MALTKAELMRMVLKQQESLNAQSEELTLLNERLRLLERQNELLWDYNFKLTEGSQGVNRGNLG